MLIIPKLSMPAGCELCPCNSESYCLALYFLDKEEVYSLPAEYAYSEVKRHPECPLIEKNPGIRILRDK